MVKQFKETQMEGRRLLHLGIAACMLMLVMVICHAEPVFAKNFEMDLDANKVTYTLTEAKSGSVIFGEANTTGYIYIGQKPDTFVVKNDTDKVIRVGMYVTTESPVTLTWFADFGPALMSQTINRSESAVITGQTAKPGEEVSVQYGYIKEENKNVKTLPRLKVRAKITVTDEPVYKTVVKKEPKIEVTKMSADQAGIQVDVNNGGAGVRGVSKIYVYKGSKKIKTFTSAATSKYTFTYKAKGAGSAKYKAKVEMIENKNDAKTSKAVSPKANTYSLKVSTKLSDYEEDEIKFVTQSLSYSGNTIIVKGYTVNTIGAGSAKYKAKVEMIENKNDAKTSKAVSPKANTYSLKVSTKLSDYEEDEIKFVTQSLSYSGNTIIVKGYTVNTMGADLAYPFYTYASCPGKLIYQYRSPANKVIKKGIHKYTFKVKNVSVVDLRHCGINVK